MAHLILAHLAQNSGSTTDFVKKIIEENKMSIMNAADEVVLVLSSVKAEDKPSFKVTEKLAHILKKALDNINTDVQMGQSAEEIENYISSNLKNKVVHHLSISEEELKQLSALLPTNRRVHLY